MNKTEQQITIAEKSLRRRIEAQLLQDMQDGVFDDSADELDEQEAYDFLYPKNRSKPK
jgi:hypothetical protein